MDSWPDANLLQNCGLRIEQRGKARKRFTFSCRPRGETQKQGLVP